MRDNGEVVESEALDTSGRGEPRASRLLGIAASAKYAGERGSGRTEASSVLGLELAVVVANEGSDVIGHVEQLRPLLLVERDGEAAEPVHGHAALLAHLDAAAALRP